MKFLLHGPDDFRLRRRLADLKARFMEMRDKSGINVVRLRRGEHDVAQVAEALFASPFLAERKMVLLDGYLSGPAEGQEEIASLLARAPDSVVAIFIEEVETKKIEKSPLFAMLSGEKFTEHFPIPGPAELEDFLIEEARRQGIELARTEARLLIEAIGDDARALHGELTKLCAYAAAKGAHRIERAMLTELVPGARDADMFAFMDACTDGRCGPAQVILDDMLAGGASEYQVIAMLERQFRILVAAAGELRGGPNPDTTRFATALGVHPFPAGKAIAAARRRPYDWYDARHKAILDIERKAKTGPGSLPAMLATFIESLR